MNDSMNTDTLHPQCAALLASLPPAPATFTPEGARAGHVALSARVCGPAPDVAAVTDLEVPAGRFAGLSAPGGASFDEAECPAIPLRRYLPRQGATRALVYLHGGGWVQGTLDTYDVLCRQLALACDAQVFSVDYRLSPECRFPGAIVDSVRAMRFVHDEAEAFGIDPAKIIVAGDSAGGHLAVTAARWLKADGQRVPAGMGLVYPVADRRLANESVRKFGEGFYLSKAQMAWFWQQFLGEQPSLGGRAIAPEDPDLSPALADDLAGLPPSLVITAGCDILRDEGEALAARLTAQGAPAEVLRVPGMLHGFIRFSAVVDDAALAVEALGEASRRWC